MHQILRREKAVTVIIPAFNEAQTISTVVQTALAHPNVHEVIVVSDGSRDYTAEVAYQAGAKVIVHERNVGKAQAMQTGIDAAETELIFFIDGDIVGLTHEMMDRAILPVLENATDMFVLIVDRGAFVPNAVIKRLPLLGGVRVLKKRMWHAVPHQYRNRFEIEIALNYFARRNHARIDCEVVAGLTQVIKEKKRGLVWGLYQRIFMMRDVLFVMAKLYVGYNVKHAFKLARQVVKN
jgi:polyisoprenyl-phosphate glycosyltransferase